MSQGLTDVRTISEGQWTSVEFTRDIISGDMDDWVSKHNIYCKKKTRFLSYSVKFEMKILGLVCSFQCILR